jgi:hypothetical protein
MAEIKGTTIKSRLEYIRETFGKEQEAEALGILKKKFGGAAAEIILPMCWYPLGMDDALCLFIKERMGLPGEQAFQELGRLSASAHLKIFRTAIGSASTPSEVIAKMPFFHNTYARDYGKMTFSEASPNRAELTIAGHRETYRSACASNVAYIAEVCGLTTGVKVRPSEPACLCKGGSSCVYRFDW